MGQSSSTSTSFSQSTPDGMITNELEFLHEQIRKHSLTLRQLTFLTFDEFHGKVNDLNALSSKFVDCNGKQLLFEVKPGSDSHVIWKGTVKIKCIKMDPQKQKVEKCRELNLKQFLQVYNTLQQHLSMNISSDPENLDPMTANPKTGIDEKSTDDAEGSEAGASCSKHFTFSAMSPLNASIFLDKMDELPDTDTNEDCCICMERKPEVSLPCAHSYCLACIEQWNVGNKTCPICREKLETTDDTWVLEDRPDPSEVTKEIQKSLFDLTK